MALKARDLELTRTIEIARFLEKDQGSIGRRLEHMREKSLIQKCDRERPYHWLPTAQGIFKVFLEDPSVMQYEPAFA